jgi:hypothetical protein
MNAIADKELRAKIAAAGRDLRKIALIMIDAEDASRLDCDGGYPSHMQFVGNNLCIASIDHDGAAVLSVHSDNSLREAARQFMASLAREPEVDLLSHWGGMLHY